MADGNSDSDLSDGYGTGRSAAMIDNVGMNTSCDVCTDKIEMDQEYVIRNGALVHKEFCSNGEIWFERLMRSLSIDVVAFRNSDPRTYKAMVNDTINSARRLTLQSGKQRRGKLASQCAVACGRQMVSFSRATLQHPVIYFGEVSFKKWFEDTTKLTEQEIIDKWIKESHPKDPTLKRREHGELKVAVKGHTQMLFETGAQTETRQSSGSDVDRAFSKHVGREELIQMCLDKEDAKKTAEMIPKDDIKNP